MNLFNNSNNNELDRILKRSTNNNNNVPKLHRYILNNQRKRKQKQNQNNANREFFIGKNNNIHSNTPYHNTVGTPQGHHLHTHTHRKNNRNTLLNNNINNNLQNRLRSQGRNHNKLITNNLATFGELNRSLSHNDKKRITRFINNSREPSMLELEQDFVYNPEQQLRRYEVPFDPNNLIRTPRRRSGRKTTKRRTRKRRKSTYNNNVSNYVVLNSNKVKRAKRWNSIKNIGRKISSRSRRGLRSIKKSGKKIKNRIKKSFRKPNKKKRVSLDTHIKKLENKMDELRNEQVRRWARNGPQVLGEGTGLLRAAPSRISDLLVRAQIKLDELKQERNNITTNGGTGVYQ